MSRITDSLGIDRGWFFAAFLFYAVTSIGFVLVFMTSYPSGAEIDVWFLFWFLVLASSLPLAAWGIRYQFRSEAGYSAIRGVGTAFLVTLLIGMILAPVVDEPTRPGPHQSHVTVDIDEDENTITAVFVERRYTDHVDVSISGSDYRGPIDENRRRWQGNITVRLHGEDSRIEWQSADDPTYVNATVIEGENESPKEGDCFLLFVTAVQGDSSTVLSTHHRCL